MQLAFTVSADSAISGEDWTGCDLISIGSGASRFTGWNHLYDLSSIDELRIFDKVLTQEEILEI